MKKISELIPTAMKSLKDAPATLTTNKKALPVGHVSRLFRLFKMNYGTAFTSNFKSDEEVHEAKEWWSVRLAHLTGEQIKFGVENMGKNHKTFPPNINEFIAICNSAPSSNSGEYSFIRIPQSLTVSKETVCNGIKDLKKKYLK